MRLTGKIVTAASVAALLLVVGSGSVLAASRWDRAYVADMDVRGAPGDALLTDGLGTYLDDEGGVVVRLYDNAEGNQDVFDAYTAGSRYLQLDLGSTSGPTRCVRGRVYATSYATPQWFNQTPAGGTTMVDGVLHCWLDSRATTGWIIGYPNDVQYGGPNSTGECLEMTRVPDDADADAYDDWTLEAPPTCVPAYLYWAEYHKGKGGGYKYNVVDWDANGAFKVTIDVLSTIADSR